MGQVSWTDIKPPGLKHTFNGDSPLCMLLNSGLGVICSWETGPWSSRSQFKTFLVDKDNIL